MTMRSTLHKKLHTVNLKQISLKKEKNVNGANKFKIK